MTNLALATDITLTSTLPAGALYVGSSPAATYDTSLGSVDWGFRLALDQTTDVHLTFQAPPTDQAAVLRLEWGAGAYHRASFLIAACAGDSGT